MAKQKFCITHGINYKKSKEFLKAPWENMMKEVSPLISVKEARERGRELTRPFKQGYDEWMKQYRSWAEKFALRRGRRAIVKI